MTLRNWARQASAVLSRGWPLAAAALGLILLTGTASEGQPTVTTLGGGSATTPYWGHVNGNTYSQAKFNFPAGMAMDPSGTMLFVADYTNNAIRLVSQVGNNSSSVTSDFANATNNSGIEGINRPLAVSVDYATNVYVLNHGNGNNGAVLHLSGLYLNYGLILVYPMLASNLVNATAMTMDSSNNLYVTVNGNKVIRVTTNQVVTTVGTITQPGTSLQGIAMLDNGQLALTDAGNNGIWMMNSTNGAYTAFTGFHGASDTNGPAQFVSMKSPANIVAAGGGYMVFADRGNNKVKTVDQYGTVGLLYGVSSNLWLKGAGKFPGWADGPGSASAGSAESRQPYGVLVGPDGTVYVTEVYYHVLRHVTTTGLGAFVPPPPAPLNLTATPSYGQIVLTWSPVVGATNYIIRWSPSNNTTNFAQIGTSSTTSFTDYRPNGSTNYYEVSAQSPGGQGPVSAIAMAVVPTPPPPPPEIGWFDYELIGLQYVTVLHPVSSATFNNDQLIAINPLTNGVSTYYTIDGSDPSPGNGFTPPFYQDGLLYAQPLPAATQPILVIKAENVDSLGQASPTTTAEFFFQVANPTITGNNGAQFQVSDITSNAVLYYTLDGTDPTNGPPSIGPISLNNSNSVTLSFVVTSNTLFKVRGFRNGYTPSGIAQQSFSISNFVANTISFGFTSGEASSAFVASPGQTFYAPITLSVLPSAEMYSLQFNMVVTNAGPNPGPAITPGDFSFSSLLIKPVPGTGDYTTIPPYMFIGNDTGPLNPGQIVNYEGTNFVDLLTQNTSLNLLAVGWLERVTKTNLYDTGSQDLIQYSMAHDDLFLQGKGKIIVGGYAFQVPANAVSNQTYQIQIARPSATSDGIGAPGSDVYIAAPTNGATGAGAPLSAFKYVTVGQLKYIAGSVYPFRWYNAGDFGSSNIVNADVEQVFQSAIYSLNYPLAGSDFFDGMDSCGNFGALDSDPADPNNGYYTNSNVALSSPAQTSALFDGNDTTINQVVFGDGNLDVCDVYVTFRRSLDPSLTWFRRFWNNGQRVADTVPNIASHALIAPPSNQAPKPKSLNVSSVAPQVNFTAGDAIGSAGQTIQVPINATILGNYPLRVLMLNLSVVPLDGSPALTAPVSFNQVATTLGAPYTVTSDGNGNYAAVWLNSTNSGLTGTVTLGTLSVTIPATAGNTAAYAIHFDHASASPNGIASFPNQKLTGLLTTSSRTNSTYGDGIPDSWRLRWFGTVYNMLSASNACPSGDGVPNWKKYVAGVDPNVANDFPSVNSKTVPSGSTAAIHWPSVLGKQYVIMRAPSLFGSPWTVLSTNTGTGGDMEFDDNSAANTKFYRVEILP